MRRRVVAGIAITAAVALTASAIVGAVAYRQATQNLTQSSTAAAAPSNEQIGDYRSIVNGWPYPFAPGAAAPKSPPAGAAATPDADRTFVSFFYQCSWVDALLNGPASSHTAALTSLRAWNNLPSAISTADNSDGSWKAQVLDPAVGGTLTPMRNYFKTCTDYKRFRTEPGAGITLDKALPSPTTDPVAAPTPSAPARATVTQEMVGPYQVEIPIDNGPANYAQGTVTLDASGHPASYVVASGDIIDYIAQRFGFFSPTGAAFDYLNTINQVRRGGYPWPLYAGDTLNLSAFTITSVGTINGRVLHEAPPSPMPPQR